ncbi:MAG: tetratricopeptide repeat protein [Bacteroidetes bacterium]|nr:tetratricopeptide repeat protein [Bacteroidota bacterium]
MNRKSVFPTFLIFFFSLTVKTAQAGSDRIDSLLKVARNPISDTAGIKAYLALGSEFRKKEPLKCFNYSDTAFRQTMILLKKLISGAVNADNDQRKNYLCFATLSGLQSLYLRGLASSGAGKVEIAKRYFESVMTVSSELAGFSDIDLAGIGKKYFNYSCIQQGRMAAAGGNYDRALEFYMISLDFCTATGYKFGIADAHNNISSLYYSRGDFQKMVEHLFLSMKICEEIKDYKSLSSIYNNIGLFYDSQGNYRIALEYYLKGLALIDTIADRKGLANSYLNIGIIHRLLGNKDRPLEYYKMSEKIYTETDDPEGLSKVYVNYANYYSDQGDLTLSVRYLKKSILYRELLGQKRNIAHGFTNLAAILVMVYEKNDPVLFESVLGKLEGAPGEAAPILLDSAECYLDKAMAIQNAVGDMMGLTYSYNGLGNIMLKRHNYPMAYKYYRAAYELSASAGARKEMLDALKGLYEEKKSSKQYKEALEYFEEFKTRSDSLFNEENRKNITRTEMRFEYDQKLKEQKSAQEKKEIVSREEIKRQKVFRNSFILISLLVLIIAVVLFNRYRIKKKSNEQLTKQNTEIRNQKEIIEKQKEDIVDSIEYASYIQKAILPEPESFSQLFPESFLFYRPRDIVSGDFYWITDHKGSKYLVTADCTGHGVPGAFLSMLGTSLFREVIMERNILSPDKIFDSVRGEIINALRQRSATAESRDGMDAVMIRLTGNPAHVLEIAAANNSFYLVRNGVLTEIRGDRFPVGVFRETEDSFTLHTLKIEKGDMIYLATDGYEDQFGTDKGKKFKSARLKELLTSIASLPMDIQKGKLEKSFDEWKGSVEQTDDVTVIGIRV